MKGFNEEGKVLVYGENEFMKRIDLLPVCTIVRDGVEYAIIDNKDEDTALCYPCVEVPFNGDPMDEITSMINYIDPEAEQYLLSSGKLVEFVLE